MENLLDNITSLFEKNDFNDLYGATNEKKFLFAYAYYHYYFGDEDSLIDVRDNCHYNNTQNNFAQGFFVEETYEKNVLDVLVPYFVEDNEEFDPKTVLYRAEQVSSTISRISQRTFGLSSQDEIISNYLKENEEFSICIRVITNIEPTDEVKENLISRIGSTKSYDDFTFDIVFGDEVNDDYLSLVSDRNCVENGSFEIDESGNYLKYNNGSSVIVNIKASSIKENYKKYSKSGLFAMNLRFYIKDKKVDPEIEKTIKTQSDLFWYLNNGIIIMCDDFSFDGDKVNLKNFSIVNGGQTTRMIGATLLTTDFLVSCKIIKNIYANDVTKATSFAGDIAQASNNQKPIKSEDLIANRIEQRMLKNNLASVGIFVSVKRGDSSVLGLKQTYPEQWQKTTNVELAQMLYAGMYQMPGTARNNKDQLFSNQSKYDLLFKNKDYDLLFLKDILFYKTIFKKYQRSVVNESADTKKIGLVKNGNWLFFAIICLIAKLIYSDDLTKFLIENGVNSDNGKNILKQMTFNHRIFSKDYCELDGVLFNLFDFIYDRYISRQYDKALIDKPSLVYSNFTKVDLNYYEYIVNSVFDEFYDTNLIPDRVKKMVDLIYYKCNEQEEVADKDCFDKSKDADIVVEIDEIPDHNAEVIKDKLISLRDDISKNSGMKANSIFTNSEIGNICRLKPSTIITLESSSCFANKSHTKTVRYGTDIINIIKGVLGINE